MNSLHRRLVYAALTISSMSAGFSAAAGSGRPAIKFGEPAAEDFMLSAVPFDPEAGAIVIADIGRTEYKNISTDDLVMLFTRTIRVKIISKDGIAAGTRQLWLKRQRAHGMEMEVLDKLVSLKAIVFNQEGGRRISTVLDPSQVFTESETYGELKKFTLPALKEGSVFDLTYTISSDWSQLIPAWHFQSAFPCLWSEYTIVVPPAFNFVMQRVGDDQYSYQHKEDVYQQFAIQKEHGVNPPAPIMLEGNSLKQTWAKKDLSGIHNEDFVSSTDNFTPAIFFQFNYYRWMEGSTKGDNKASWTRVTKDLIDENYFGGALNTAYNWDAEWKEIQPVEKTPEERARHIYRWVRDNFRCTGFNEKYTDRTLKQIEKTKSGSEVEINLLLTALLRQAGIAADPAMLSTRDHGVADQSYPQLSQFNYIICAATINGKRVTLDACHPQLGFGKLAPDCYNGLARIISLTDSSILTLYADSLLESQNTSVFISNDDKDFLVGSFQEKLGDVGAMETREKTNSHSFGDRMKTLSDAFSGPVHIENSAVDSTEQPDAPVTLHFDFDLKEQAGQDILYFNPVLERNKTNPFPAAKRQFPVELPYCLDANYNLSMEIPKGYVVEEIPKSAKVNLNGTDGYFEYIVQQSVNRIQMRVRLKFYKSIFSVADYNILRDFYAFVVKKEAEQIVFKKIR